MGGSSSPSLPAPPEFQVDPDLAITKRTLGATGLNLVGGGFIPGVSVNLPRRYQGEVGSDLSHLYPLVELNPEATQTAVNLASRDVIRMRNDAQQSILNQLEANNQLTSSVTGDALSELNREFSADISDIATTFYLADVERSMQNRYNLFQLGLQTTGQAAQVGLGNQSQMNQFALDNYSNQVAYAMSQEEASNAGLLGGGIGTLAGAAIGTAIAPGVGTVIGAGIGGAVGGAAGDAFGGGSSGTPFISGGMQMASSGVGMGGGGLGSIGSGISSGTGTTNQTAILSDLLGRSRQTGFGISNYGLA